MARYYIQAKRKGSDEKWSEWTEINDYQEAIYQVEWVCEVGYDSKLVVSPAVQKLWDILDGFENKFELTDKILDAGFCLRDETVNRVMYDLKRIVHNKAVYPHDESYSFINLNVFDAVLQNYVTPIWRREQDEQISQ
jgi:hypothetical protein